MSRLRPLLVAAVAAGLLVPGAPAAATASSADLAVDLTPDSMVLLPLVDYQVSVTNNGPQPLTSATVVVSLDPRATPPSSPPCAYANATLTCTFGALPVGATATLTNRVYYDVMYTEAVLDATATRTASTPADPVAANDTDTARCRHEQESVGFPPLPYYMWC